MQDMFANFLKIFKKGKKLEEKIDSRITDRPTDQINYILDAHSIRESSLNISAIYREEQPKNSYGRTNGHFN